jgi:hypothetical protein
VPFPAEVVRRRVTRSRCPLNRSAHPRLTVVLLGDHDKPVVQQGKLLEFESAQQYFGHVASGHVSGRGEGSLVAAGGL